MRAEEYGLSIIHFLGKRPTTLTVLNNGAEHGIRELVAFQLPSFFCHLYVIITYVVAFRQLPGASN